MSRTLAAILGGAAAGLALVVIAVGLVWFFMLHCKDFSNKNSETGSSDPPAPVEWNRGGRVSSAGCGSLPEPHGAKCFTLEELEQATKDFSDSNLVGEGSFGSVYKGLLCDGTIVAIKRRTGAPRKEFVEEVQHMSEIWHRNLVTLIGFCLEGSFQMLVYEYVPNGSISGHLYGKDNRHNQIPRLEFKQRLSVALGAAKGLRHLHGLAPPFVHRDFKTSNVLVDENFIAKVADAGIVNLLQITECGSSQTSRSNLFQDPEVGELGQLSEMSDVYSFGVFLLELVMGQEVISLNCLESSEGLTQWVESCMHANDLVDQRLGNSFTSEGMRGLIALTLQCLDLSWRSRPKMDTVVSELDRILETEMTLTTVMGDGTAIVTLGSQLFTSA